MGWGWSPDFCLACDRQTTGGVYCSQACRLADLERASPSVSPRSSTGLDAWPAAMPTAGSGFPSSSLPLASPGSLGSSGFCLPPPIDFSAYRRQPLPPSSSSSTTDRAQQRHEQQRQENQSIHPWSERSSDRDHHHHRPARPGLPSSSSQTSLSSLHSSSTVDDSRLSEETRTELRAYASCFDRLRDLKQRYISRS